MRHLNATWWTGGALALGAGAVLVLGAGTAHADAESVASASDGARSAGPAARSSAPESGQRVRGSSAITASRTAAAPTPAPCLQSQTCGTTTLTPKGPSEFQEWIAPAGVQSVLVSMQGGFGGPGGNETNFGQPAFLQANVSVTGPIPGGLGVFVPTGGLNGGSGGGGAGGSGSLSGNGGGGGGGAASVSAIVSDVQGGEVFLLVAGGGGGSGGDRNGAGGSGGDAGGVDIPGPPPSGGVWPGSDGSPGTSDDNPGAGGAGGAQSSGNGSDGGDAETGSGNGGGGGGGGGAVLGGGGAYGGSGGQPGQAGLGFSTAGSGGGGGGGSSYANPTYTTLAVAGPPITLNPDSPFDGFVIMNWVDILTTALRPMRAGRTTDQQLAAASFLQTGTQSQPTLTWSAAGLPEGLTLSPSGVLSGKPKKAGPYSFVATVQGVTAPGVLVNGGLMDISSVITYSGTVCDRRCGRGGRT